MKTTTTIEQSTAPTIEQLKPEWLKIRDAVRVSGLGRSTLYTLLSSGDVKSAVVRKRGNLRGRRLVSYDSLTAYIQNCITQDSGWRVRKSIVA